MRANLKIEAIGYGTDQQLKDWKRLFHGVGIPIEFSKIRYWVAEVTYKGFDFLLGKTDYSKANSKATRGVYINFILESGKVYAVSKPESWRSTSRFFATVSNDGEILKHESIRDAKKTIEQECS